MSMSNMDYRAITDDVLAVIRSAGTAEEAMTGAVGALKERLPRYDWVGVYLLQSDTLELGPFRGEPSPHTRIPLGRGICGAAAAAKKTIIVPNVNADPRHLACSIKTKSEIVVPIMHGTDCLGEIDIDSHTPDAFSSEDRIMLESIAAELAQKLGRSDEQRVRGAKQTAKDKEGHMISAIGATAGKVYQKLSAKGSMSMSQIKKEVGDNDAVITMAIGWLAREGKLISETTIKGTVLKLRG